MTHLALIADVHSDSDALAAALRRIDDLCADAVVLCLGDAVDYELPPGTEETIRLLRDRRVVAIAGNHERWVLADGRAEQRLSPTSVDWLRSLPCSWSETIDGVRVVAWHARPGSDMDGIDSVEPCEVPGLLSEAEADLLVVGHTHEPLILEALDRPGLIVNPGALARSTGSQPPWLLDPETGRFSRSEPKPGGTFTVVELPDRRVAVHRVEAALTLTNPAIVDSAR
jgi:predicted phosphodiesterase